MIPLLLLSWYLRLLLDKLCVWYMSFIEAISG